MNSIDRLLPTWPEKEFPANKPEPIENPPLIAALFCCIPDSPIEVVTLACCFVIVPLYDPARRTYAGAGGAVGGAVGTVVGGTAVGEGVGFAVGVAVGRG